MQILDLGQCDYQEAWRIQEDVHAQVQSGSSPNTLIFVEHHPVLTLGRGFHEENLTLPREQYERLGIQIHPTDRGGDVTYHGPGQIVIYPIFHLDCVGKDLHRWLRALEQTIIDSLDPIGIKADRFPPHTGAWIDTNGTNPRKIAAIGVKVSKWVSIHGIALNVNLDLSVYDLFVPCGIKEHPVTSIEREAPGALASLSLQDFVPADWFSRCKHLLTPSFERLSQGELAQIKLA